MALPKRKPSKQVIRTRRNTKRAILQTVSTCAQCGEPHQAHRACPACGYYAGRQVLTVSAE